LPAELSFAVRLNDFGTIGAFSTQARCSVLLHLSDFEILRFLREMAAPTLEAFAHLPLAPTAKLEKETLRILACNTSERFREHQSSARTTPALEICPHLLLAPAAKKRAKFAPPICARNASERRRFRESRDFA
jgi:hypothetical protein